METEDFVEIINTGPAPVNIAGYFFGDENGGSIIPSGYPELTTVSSGQVLLLWFDNDPEQGPLHIDAKLNNDGEVVLCLNEDGDTIINISFPWRKTRKIKNTIDASCLVAYFVLAVTSVIGIEKR